MLGGFRRLTVWLRRRGGEEHGTVLLIVAALMTAMLGFGAYTIDVGSGRQSETKAQSVADAAATAAADDISASDPSGTDTTQVHQDATSQAVANGACGSCVTVSYPYNNDYNEVQVIITGSSTGALGGSFGRSSIPVKATAIASNLTSTVISSTVSVTNQTNTTSSSTVVSGTTSTTKTTTQTVQDTDEALFAMDQSCNDTGVSITGNSSVAIDGDIWSNGNATVSGNSSGEVSGTFSYGESCGAPASTLGGSGNPQTTPDTTFPDQPSLSKLCPSFKTGDIDFQGESSVKLSGVYCTKGNINITGNSSVTGSVTLVANQITISGNSSVSLTPDDGVFAYQTGGGTLTISGGSAFQGGLIYAPTSSSTVLISGNSAGTVTGYIEAWNISLNGNSQFEIQGDGTGASTHTTTTTTVVPVTTSSTSSTVITHTTPMTSTITNTNTVGDGSALSG